MKYIAIGMLIVGILLHITSRIIAFQTKLTRMDETLQKIAKQVGVPEPSIDNELLRALVAEGKNVEAVKRVRMVLGLGLKEAKEYVDAL